MPPVPGVKVTKSDGNTGVVKPSPTGVLAIIAASQQGTVNQPGSFTRQDLALSTYGYGPLVEYSGYDLAEAELPTLLIRANASVAGAYGTISIVKSGTSAITAGASTPLDEFAPVVVLIITGGTIGVTGITYQYALDGVNFSGIQALGTASVLSIPNSGVSFNLGAGTLVAGDTWSVYTTRPQPNNADLTAALEALRVTKIPWENVLIDMDLTTTNAASVVSLVDTWLTSLEASGEFHAAFLNSRHKLEPVPTTESEATFAASMGNAFGQSSTIRLFVGSDAGDLTSTVTGIVQPRPVSLAAATRCASIPVGTDPAYVALGQIPGFSISDGNGNPKWHDEQLYPNLDGLRLTTFRTVPGEQGPYLTNVDVLSPSGSDYVFAQHVRCMNVACAIGFQSLTQQLSKGVGKKAPDPITGAIYILEQDAAAIEAFATAAIVKALKGQVAAAALELSRTDDLSSNAGAIINAQIQIEALAYLKQFNVIAKFVKSIQVQA